MQLHTGGDLTDRLGHGTAVAGAIHEKAPDAALLAVKVFDRSLKTSGRALVEAIRWAAGARVAIINLSLGTSNREHEVALAGAVADALAASRSLADQGITLAAGPKQRPDGPTQIYVYDPDGHLVELFSRQMNG